MKKIYLLIIVGLLVWNTNEAATKTAKNGNWNSASTWTPSGVPVAGDDVVIPLGVTVTVNCNCGPFSNMRMYVYGKLDFNNGQKINLASDGELHMFSGGELKGGNGGSKFNIGNNTIWRGSDPTKTGPDLCTVIGCGSTPVPLPVTLIDFVAELTEDAAKIEWATASEVNNDYFVVQRKQEASWESIGEVHGFGTTNKIHYYQYDDFDIDMSKLAYYRLKQVDIDGEVDYSKIIDVSPISLKGHDYSFISIGNNVRLKFEDDHNEATSIYVINAEGMQVRGFDFDTINKGDELSIELEGLVKGWYVVGIIGQDNAHFEKMMYVK